MAKLNFIQLLFFVFLLLVPGRLLSARDINTEPRLDPDPLAVYFSENFDSGDWRSLFDVAYWGSGNPDWTSAKAEFEPVLEKFSVKAASMDMQARAEAVLEFMHEEFLTAYQLKQSRLDVLFANGRYNCLSSAVLYAIIGTAVGLEVTGVNTIDHAFCTVHIGDEDFDVETTNPYGFNPGKKTDFHDAFGKVTGFSYVPPGNYRDRNEIDLRRLFALLLQNRIADAESANRFGEAVGLAVDRWTLLGRGTGPAYEDVIVRLLNYGTMLSRAGREEDALDWIDRSVNSFGEHPKWADFTDGVVNNLLVKLIRKGRLEEARLKYESLKPRLSDETAESLDLLISDTELIAALDAARAGADESLFFNEVDRIRKAGVVSEKRIKEVEINWSLYSISLIAENEGWAAAYNAAEKAIAEIGNDPQLENARRIYLSNQKAELYNAAADAYNSRKYNEAMNLINEAIVKFPDEAVFQRLHTAIERALQ